MHLGYLTKRDWSDDTWSGGGGARWAFFAVFIVLIIIVVLGTMRVNKKRSQQGIQPIYGTRWMTPPSYVQSQNYYNQPNSRDPDMPANYVPAYSAEATENDMGYYDNSGKFHANPNAKNRSTVDVEQTGVEYPENAHQRLTSIGTGAPVGRIPTLHEDGEEMDDLYRPPPGPPPSSTARGQSTTANERTT